MRCKHSSTYILIGVVAVFSMILVGNGALHGQMAGSSATSVLDPNSYVFRLELDGTVVAEYTECSGLGSGNGIKEDVVIAGAPGPVVRKSAGALRWPDISLRRKGLGSDNVWSWRKAMADGQVDAGIRDGAIVVCGVGSLEPVARWAFRRGWAASLTLDDSMETLVIVHEGLERAGVSPPNVVRPR